MKPVEFEGQTNLLGLPQNTPKGWCGALPIKIIERKITAKSITLGNDVQGIMYEMHSYWKPTPEEIEQLKNGAHIKLCIHGKSHPPVWINIEKCIELP